MSGIYIFVGPTLPADEVARLLPDATVLPPAAQGDLYLAARQQPWAIGLIDGYFEHLPAVWHKEILWAMSRGVHVFGSASMGALRAAETADYGMEGVGEIYESFRRRELEDDDEVAVIHAAAERGYRQLSEAMVDIRASLAAAAAAGILRAATQDALVRLAKELYYPERNLPNLLDAARREALPDADLDGLAAWWPENRVRLKRRDALAMLHHMAEHRRRDPSPKRVRYHFPRTETWDLLRRDAESREIVDLSTAVDGSAEPAETEVLEELRLEGAVSYQLVRERAQTRALGLELAERQSLSLEGAKLEDAITALRRRHGLLDPGAAKRWILEQGLDAEGFVRLAEDEGRLDRINALWSSQVERRALPAQLRAEGRYGELMCRARAKRALPDVARLVDMDLTEDELWRWYFEDHLDVPRPPDLEAYAHSLDLPGAEDLRRAVLREWLVGMDADAEPG